MREAFLPHGALRDGVCRRDAVLRAPTGADEAVLVEELAGASAAARADALLARCLVRVGGVDSPGPEGVGELVAGDREALLLQLRALAFGERLGCLLDCPGCGEPLAVDVLVGDLLADPYADVAAEHEAGGVRFRLPTAADLEAAAEAADPSDGADVLLGRCVRGGAWELSEQARETVDDALARLDPQAALDLDTVCPSCAEPVAATLDAGALLLDELAASADGLFGEVHALARHYHWSEGDILALALPRRRRYLELLVADEAADGAALETVG